MRILHIVPRWHYGGAATSVLMEAKIARQAISGIQHQAMTLEPGGSLAHMKEAMRYGLRVRMAPGAIEEAELVKSVDAVVLHYWNTPSVWSFLDRWRGESLRWMLYSRVNGAHRPQLLPLDLARSACHVVLTSPHMQEQIGHDRVTVLPAVARLPDAAAKPWSDDGSPVVHAGTLNVFKLSPHFIPLHADVSDPGHPMEIAGSGGDEERFQEEAESMGVASQFRWVGFSNDLPSLFDGAGILSHPVSRFSYASSDRVIQESQVAGLPVLVQSDAPIAHLVRDNVTGVLANDLGDFREKLLAIIRNEHPLPDRAAVREAALEDHNPVRKCGVLNSIYEDVRGGPARQLDAGFGSVTAWLDFQVGDASEIVGHRRPSLAELRNDYVLAAHQRWGCEGGLAQYLNVFPTLSAAI